MFHWCIAWLGFLEEAARAKVKVSSFPLPPSLISCPLKTGPVRPDNNADYTRGRLKNSVLTSPQPVHFTAKDGSIRRLMYNCKTELKANTRNIS